MPKQTKLPIVLSLTSGKGGVGKTNMSVNLAYCLSRLGKKTLLLDADLGLANVDVILGLNPRFNLFHLFHENMDLQKIILPTDYGFDILPSASGVTEMLSLSTGQKLELLEVMDTLENELDYLIVDTGAGINENVIYFNLAVQERIIILTPEPTSLTDAYALIKVLKIQHGIERFRVVVNMAKSQEEAREVFKKLYNACDHFLSGISLDLSGIVPMDLNVRKGVASQQPFCHYAPNSKASKALMHTAESMTKWKPAENLDGNIKFFWKKLLFQE
ncbi:Cobyrinic acid ac-diamide synthase [Desulfonatronospira thiodismutans ASO3-1]|uniref:Cobyrinic acid ac-diamide synthase n=1 Tax=Desulfonatronospira thiodismutans ASO3-1 TaxID=555779 RepID=D6SMP8_9BACT|nr:MULTISPECIES: MinD/ParA family protein [Desulfonatronospira]EFI35959.1 Cobyrinic acid ac-diamide synthase [Desulfonatronospira thiodismutans ASO3-1]RQD79309.1 MAG: MinD/ParA family protein [Desulfonatronospira sp. MSAO_Bac3]